LKIRVDLSIGLFNKHYPDLISIVSGEDGFSTMEREVVINDDALPVAVNK
jgi:hypothetical protein